MLGADIVGAMVIDTISLGLYLDGTSEDRSEVLLGQIRVSLLNILIFVDPSFI